jgi:hypothetical protein
MQDEITITKADLERACDDLAMLEFFPHNSRASVMVFLGKLCAGKGHLRWLVDELVNHVGKWPGPAEVRGLLCSRFDPADGVDQWCSLPGYTAEEAAAKTYAKHLQLTGKSEGYEALKETGLSKAVRGDGGYVAEESKEMMRKLLDSADRKRLT